jgi:hypothetical protein
MGAFAGTQAATFAAADALSAPYPTRQRELAQSGGIPNSPKRFEVACRRLGLNADDWWEPLDTTRFRPLRVGPQMDLF